MDMHVRWLIRADLPAILDIEVALPAPWTEEAYLDMLKHRNCIAMVVEAGNGDRWQVIGGMVYSLNKSSIELDRFVVHSDWRRRGAGTALMKKLLTKLSGHKRTRACMTVPDDSLDAHLFLKAQGWEAVRVDRQWGEQDQYRFVYRIPATEGVPVGAEEE